MTFIRVLVETDKSEVCNAYEGLLEQIKRIMCEAQGVPESKQVCLSARNRVETSITACAVTVPC